MTRNVLKHSFEFYLFIYVKLVQFIDKLRKKNIRSKKGIAQKERVIRYIKKTLTKGEQKQTR